jgi:hypothetical protein
VQREAAEAEVEPRRPMPQTTVAEESPLELRTAGERVGHLMQNTAAPRPTHAPRPSAQPARPARRSAAARRAPAARAAAPLPTPRAKRGGAFSTGAFVVLAAGVGALLAWVVLTTL